jgi:hypothetical protein
MKPQGDIIHGVWLWFRAAIQPPPLSRIIFRVASAVWPVGWLPWALILSPKRFDP